MDQLDQTDVTLIELLQRDAKMPLKEIGERIGMSAPSVMERIRRLEKDGVITGYYAAVDARKVGLDVSAFIGVSINKPGELGSFQEWVESVPNILESHHVTGGHTLLLKVKTENTRSLEKLISRIRSLDGVESTETMVVLSSHIERVQLPLENRAETAQPRRNAKKRRAA